MEGSQDVRRMRRIAEAWNNAVAHTLTRGSANYDPGDDIPDAATRRQFYFLGALAALNCLLNGARPSALQDEVETASICAAAIRAGNTAATGRITALETRSS